MDYYIGAFWFGIVPAAVVVAVTFLIGQIRPLRKAVMKWLES